jgi:hypothetical protein
MVAGTLYLAAHVEMNVSTHFWAEKDLMRTASSHLVDLSTMVKRWVNPMHVRKYSLRHRNGVG